ncbi:putative clathrin assembly protein At1g03050 [Coffea arabica]|uniref:Clathrin assembly protein At1g03050 n=1 Tax=Coffea arabica TaxID=13443 RepID=A0A6P6V956_COFAR|nr:putative clathrin assembly protein At2g25430 [Coffea arabica]
MQRRIRQVLCSVKEHTSVNCAKIATIGGFCDLDHVVIKATSPEDLPFNEKYIHEIMKIFSISPTSYREFALCFNRRFRKTECWRVALKSLVLLHRLLRSLPEDSPFRAELLWARSNRYISLYPCDFQDFSSSSAEDYTDFIRSYARLLDEAIDCSAIEFTETDEDDMPDSFPDKMKELGRMIEVLTQLQSLIDRVMDCRPTGAAAKNFVVQSTMKNIIRDSFMCYTTFRKQIVVVLDNLIQLPYRSCAEAFDIYKKAAIQADDLSEFYNWSKSMGFCGAYEFPFVDRIPLIQIRALGAFLNGMWQLTESSSSTMSQLTSNVQSPSSISDDEADEHPIKIDEISATTNKQVKLEEETMKKALQKDKEIGPLIQLDVENNVSWEALLEASLPSSCIDSRRNVFFPNGPGYGQQYGDLSENPGYADRMNGWQMQVYTPCVLPSSANPFLHTNSMPIYHVPFPANPTYPWGL